MVTFYFYLVSFTYSISYSVLPFHLVYILQFMHLFFFFDVLSQAFIKYSRKKFSLHMYKYVQYIYFRKLMNSCLTKKIMTSWFHLFDLIWRDL